MSGKGKNNAEPQAPTFEQAMKRLEEIVRQMESGDLPLEKMLEVYEEGRQLLDYCAAKLDEVEKKIELLEKKDGQWTMRAVTESDLRAPAQGNEENVN